MTKVICIEIGQGSFEQGFDVTIKFNGGSYRGKLSSNSQIVNSYELWQKKYSKLDKYRRRGLRGKCLDSENDEDENPELLQQCNDSAVKFENQLDNWLRNPEHQQIREKLSAALGTESTEEIRVIIKTDTPLLKKIPWHKWDLLADIQRKNVGIAMGGLSSNEAIYHKLPSQLRILAILGNGKGIHLENDEETLSGVSCKETWACKFFQFLNLAKKAFAQKKSSKEELNREKSNQKVKEIKLPGIYIKFLQEPERTEIGDHLWEQNWNILFFAGHSSSQGQKGRLYINSHPDIEKNSFEIEELENGLELAIKNGLQLAIFNSCDGLKLAEELNVPHTIFMSEPILDVVAHQFLLFFLQRFSSGESLHLAVRQARERLSDKAYDYDNKFPGSSWLPVIYQNNPDAIPLSWKKVCKKWCFLRSLFIGSIIVVSLSLVLAQGNNPPEIGEISKQGTEDENITFIDEDFTSQFKDSDNDKLVKVQIVSLPGPNAGTLEHNQTPVIAGDEINVTKLKNLVFFPKLNWNGIIDFRWKGHDGTEYSDQSETVTITLTSVNDLPTVKSNSSDKEAKEDESISITKQELIAYFEDVDKDDSLTKIQIVDISSTSLTLRDQNSHNIEADKEIELHNFDKLDINLPDNQYGSFNFSFKVHDAIGYSEQKATVELKFDAVNDLPTVDNFEKSGMEDQNILFTEIDFTTDERFQDVDGDKLAKIKITSLPSPKTGILKVRENRVKTNTEVNESELKYLIFEPVENWNGKNEFQFASSDGKKYSKANAIIKLVIDPVNDLPIVSDFTKEGAEDNILTFAKSDFSTNFTDVDKDDLNQVQITALPEHGTLKLGKDKIVEAKKIGVNSLANLYFIPTKDWYGSTTFAWNGYDGEQYSEKTAIVNIKILSVNDPPSSEDFSKEVRENDIIHFTKNDFVDHFTDVDDDDLTKVKIVSLPNAKHGILKLKNKPINIDSYDEIFPHDLAYLVFEPSVNWHGSTNFKWNGSDGNQYSEKSATISITVTKKHEPPRPSSSGICKNTSDGEPAVEKGMITCNLNVTMNFEKHSNKWVKGLLKSLTIKTDINFGIKILNLNHGEVTLPKPQIILGEVDMYTEKRSAELVIKPVYRFKGTFCDSDFQINEFELGLQKVRIEKITDLIVKPLKVALNNDSGIKSYAVNLAEKILPDIRKFFQCPE